MNTSAVAQHNGSVVCRLGDAANDTMLLHADHAIMQIDSSQIDFISKNSQALTQLKMLTVEDQADETMWRYLFNVIKDIPSVQTIVLDDNDFVSLPQGYETVTQISTLIIQGNEELDLETLMIQVNKWPSLKFLSIEISSVFEVPGNLKELKNIEQLTIINTDDINAQFSEASSNNMATFDYYLEGDRPFNIKYISNSGFLDAEEYIELSKIFKTHHNYSFAINQNRSVYAPQYKFVQEPLPGINVSRTAYKINPSFDNFLVYPSGTKIFIPANSLVDESGAEVTGSVLLSYREFRDPVDILVSGIPMKYDSAGNVAHFESAGMFEIYASKDGKPLSVSNGKKIQMNFVTTSADSSFNFYEYNDSTGNWSYVSKPAKVNAANAIYPGELTVAEARYRMLLTTKPRYKDRTKFDERFEDLTYYYVVKDRNPKDKYPPLYSKNSFYDQRKYNTESLVRVNRVRKLRSGEVVFKLRINSVTHPELTEFNAVYFVSAENISASEFKKKFSYRKKYNDLFIDTKGDQVILRLKGKTGYSVIAAELAYLDDKGKLRDCKNYKTIFKKYNRKRQRRENEFNKMVKKGQNYFDDFIEIKNPDDLKSYCYDQIVKDLSLNERKMTKEEWIAKMDQYLANEKLILNKSKVTANNLVNSLSLDGFGIYNCDQIQRINEPVEIFASYKSVNNEKQIQPVATYIIDKKINAVLQYNGYRGFSADKIAFSKSKNAENTLLAIKKDGTVAIYSPADFKQNNFRNKQDFEFRVIDASSNFSNIEELKKYIGL